MFRSSQNEFVALKIPHFGINFEIQNYQYFNNKIYEN